MAGRGALGLVKAPFRAARSIPGALPHLTELPGITALPAGPTLSRTVGRFMRQDPRVLDER